MGTKICMNEVCRGTTSSEWKKGWGLKSGGYATLCSNCGSAYENSVFCETFHLEDTGWRECRLCGKRIHCGCIASKGLHEIMDFGGVGCLTCLKHSEAKTTRATQVQTHGEDVANGTLASKNFGNVLMRLTQVMEEHEKVTPSEKSNEDVAPKQLIRQQPMLPTGEISTPVPNVNKQAVGSSSFTKIDSNRQKEVVKDIYGSLAQPLLNFSLSTPLGNSSSAQSFPNGSEGREQNKGSPTPQGQKSRQILPKPPKPAPSTSSEANNPTPPQTRVARPPAEGRGRNQLLPRYWPRITDQELQQISGHLNSTIVPLFEKILSASDAGRIGRLVLPKACAEAYFPPINQSEGLPIRIQDITGKEWTFQFRFWPNNNSRMYVLEGVTPCIQNMQVQAGDTVTFSRIDPGGKLVIGCRKATNNETQDLQTSIASNGGSSGEVTFIGGNDNSATNGGGSSDIYLQRQSVNEKKKARNIGSKNKRLLIHSEDAMELRVTWEEAQDLLRPCPTARPNIILIEDLEIEEYDDPPVFGKRTIFTAQSSGEQEQWVQCDSCSKWRRVPVNVLIPAKWSCSDNILESGRGSCSYPEDINQQQLDALQRVNKDFKRRRIIETKVLEDVEPSGLDALATAAVLGDNMGDLGESSTGATTKHPRHRPGCSCIVCIQPPSGKGKHPPSCKCNVCLTVRRRFKTLMLRKKKRQSEREAELALVKDEDLTKNGSETDLAAGQALLHMNQAENDAAQMEEAEAGKEHLDLNSHPNRDDELLAAAAGMSLTTLVNSTNLPLEMYLKQSGLRSFGPRLPSQAAGGGKGHGPDDGAANTCAGVKMENKGMEEGVKPDQSDL